MIKRALLFAERIVGRMLDQGQRGAVMLQGLLNGCLAAFAEVDDRVELWKASYLFSLPVLKFNRQI